MSYILQWGLALFDSKLLCLLKCRPPLKPICQVTYSPPSLSVPKMEVQKSWRQKQEKVQLHCPWRKYRTGLDIVFLTSHLLGKVFWILLLILNVWKSDKFSQLCWSIIRWCVLERTQRCSRCHRMLIRAINNHRASFLCLEGNPQNLASNTECTSYGLVSRLMNMRV